MQDLNWKVKLVQFQLVNISVSNDVIYLAFT